MRIASNKIADIIRFFREELQGQYDHDEVETFIEYCFEEYLNIKKSAIFLSLDKTISESELLKFNFAVKDLKQNKPIQYILGKADFYGLKFKVNEHVLIPRQETEELVHLIIKENEEVGMKNIEDRNENQDSRLQTQDSRLKTNDSRQITILDIGTGSGCIPITLKKKIPTSKVYSIDISIGALNIAKQNTKLNEVEVEFIQHDILSKDALPFLPGTKFDIIVSNPPYILEIEKKQMHKNVLEHEPHIALFVNNDEPLLFYNAIADIALKYLNKNGTIYFEINEAFGLENKQMLENKGFQNVMIVKDINNKNRILRGNF